MTSSRITAGTAPASDQPADEARSRQPAGTRSSEGVTPGQAEGCAKGKAGQTSSKANAAEADPAVSGFSDGDLTALPSRVSGRFLLPVKACHGCSKIYLACC